MPFKDNTFDLITSLGVIEHFENPFPLLEEMRRVLKPEGILFLQVPNRNRFGLSQKEKEQAVRDSGYEAFYDLEELSSIAIRARFKPIKIYSEDFALGISLCIYHLGRTFFPRKHLLRWPFIATGVTVSYIFRIFNPFLKHRGANCIVEATKF